MNTCMFCCTTAATIFSRVKKVNDTKSKENKPSEIRSKLANAFVDTLGLSRCKNAKLPAFPLHHTATPSDLMYSVVKR